MPLALKPKPMWPPAAHAGGAIRTTAAASTADVSAMILIFIFQASLPVTSPKERWPNSRRRRGRSAGEVSTHIYPVAVVPPSDPPACKPPAPGHPHRYGYYSEAPQPTLTPARAATGYPLANDAQRPTASSPSCEQAKAVHGELDLKFVRAGAAARPGRGRTLTTTARPARPSGRTRNG